jgi:hypothetical protein
MRLTAYLLLFLTIAVAKTQHVRVLRGVWVSGSTCDLDPSPICNRVILNMTSDGNRLRVIAVMSGEGGNSIAGRRYVFRGALRRADQGIGTAKSDDRSTVLKASDQPERWSVSKDGYVNRWLGVSPKGPQRVSFFRRPQPGRMAAPPDG